MLFAFAILVLVQLGGSVVPESSDAAKLLAISTWNFGNATAKAWETLVSGGTAVDAVEKGSWLILIKCCPDASIINLYRCP